MSIYTRRGDSGTTRIYGSTNVISKTDPRVNSLGTVDELNSQLGVVLVHCASGKFSRVRKQLERVQQDIFQIGSEIATASNLAPPFRVSKHMVLRLERWIDDYENDLPPLANFIFPGGSLVSAQVHVARTVCRRAEREIVGWKSANKQSLFSIKQSLSLNKYLLAYVNRLSDYLLVLARWLNKLEGINDTVWNASKTRK